QGQSRPARGDRDEDPQEARTAARGAQARAGGSCRYPAIRGTRRRQVPARDQRRGAPPASRPAPVIPAREPPALFLTLSRASCYDAALSDEPNPPRRAPVAQSVER